MINYIVSHKDEVAGAIGASGVVIVDTVAKYTSGDFTQALIHDSHVIFMAVILLTIKAAYGAFAGVLIGKFISKYTKPVKGK